MRFLKILAALAAVVLGANNARAFPQFILYQGRYLNNGTPTNSSVSMEFRITNGNSVACGSALPAANLYWTSGSTGVATSNGLFSYKLGYKTDGVTQDPAFTTINWNLANTTYYIDVCVSGSSLSPKEPLGAATYSLYSSSAGALTATSPGKIQISDGTQGTGKVLTSDANGVASWQSGAAGETNTFASTKTFTADVAMATISGNVGVGTTSPGQKFDVNGSAQFGSGASKSVFTVGGSLQLFSGSTITSNGTLSISTAASAALTGTPAIYLDGQGNIGFGTTNPRKLYYFYSDGNNSQIAIDRGLASNKAMLGFLLAGSAQWTIQDRESGALLSGQTKRLDVSDGGNTRISLDNNGFVGIGTAVPVTKLHMSSGSLLLDGNGGKIETSNNTQPALSSCGAGPTIVGSDIAGKITIGGGGAAACVVTFQTAYVHAPICTVSDETNATVIKPVATTTTLTLTAAIAASDVVDFICIGAR